MQKLLLFDIDGTLIHHIGPPETKAIPRYENLFQKMFGRPYKIEKWIYEGQVDRQVVMDMAAKSGINRDEFEKKYSKSGDIHMKFLDKFKNQHPLHEVIPEATELLEILSKHRNLVIGLLTGNTEKIAWWKMEHTNLRKYFSFGLFGDEADNRFELAKNVFAKFKKTYGYVIKSKQIYVIGDTINDIGSGKAIGAYTIGVKTGRHVKQNLADYKPDLLVDHLNDSQVYKFLSR